MTIHHSRTVVLALILSLGVNAFAQTLTKAAAGPVDPMENPYLFYTKSLDERNDYLTPLLQFERHEAEYLASEKTKHLVPDLMAYLNAYVGRCARALALQERGWGSDGDRADLTQSKIDEYSPEPALKAIGELAGSHKVVMINEEHVTPQHRAFTRDLLPVMWAKGFRYFAAETFGDEVVNMTSVSYPTQKTGFYSDDPVFGDMVRTALKLGFKLIPYEDRKSLTCKNPEDKANFCQNERERGQAENLYDRTLKVDPKAKVFVHVGRGHNQKIKMDDWAMMAWHFKEISGVDPLTIDQMHSERSDPKFETPIYRWALKKWNISVPTVFRNRAGEFWQGHGHDVVIFHPRTRYVDGRAVWLVTGGRRRVKLTNSRLNITGQSYPLLVQAFVGSEGDNAIPIDQIIIDDPAKPCALVLPKGSFRIRVIDASGRISGTSKLKV
jgi:hypothetical protein